MVGGLPQIHEIKGVCEGCALGKHHRKPFQKGVAWRAKEILELVHNDLSGPMRNPSHDFNHTLKHKKKELTLVELGNHLRIKESLKMQDSDKPKGNNVAGPSVVNRVEHNNSSRHNDHRGKRKHHDNKGDPNKKSKVTCWKCGKSEHLKKNCKGGRVGNKDNGSGTNCLRDGYSNSLKDIEYIFVGYAEHFKDFRFYVIEPIDSILINSILESRDANFDENRFSSVPRPSQRFLVKVTKEFSGSVVTEEVIDEVV
nr:zinc finger, CCHC-type [Tanacetum cinerariifolium]